MVPGLLRLLGLLGRRGLLALVVLGALGVVRRLDVVGVHRPLPRTLAGRTLWPRHHGRATASLAAFLGVAAVACGVVGSVALVAHRMLLHSLAIPRSAPC